MFCRISKLRTYLTILLILPSLVFGACTADGGNEVDASSDSQLVHAAVLTVTAEVGLAFLTAGAVLAVAGQHANVDLLFPTSAGGSASHQAAHAFATSQQAISGAQQLARHTLNIELQEKPILDFAHAFVALRNVFGSDPLWTTRAARAKYDAEARDGLLRLVSDLQVLRSVADEVEQATGELEEELRELANRAPTAGIEIPQAEAEAIEAKASDLESRAAQQIAELDRAWDETDKAGKTPEQLDLEWRHLNGPTEGGLRSRLQYVERWAGRYREDMSWRLGR